MSYFEDPQWAAGGCAEGATWRSNGLLVVLDAWPIFDLLYVMELNGPLVRPLCVADGLQQWSSISTGSG